MTERVYSAIWASFRAVQCWMHAGRDALDASGLRVRWCVRAVLQAFEYFLCARGPAAAGAYLLWVLLMPLNAGASEVQSPIHLQKKSRVLAVRDEQAVDRFQANPDVVRRMFDDLLKAYTLKDDAGEAWKVFVNPDDIVGIKVLSDPGSVSGTRPAVVEAVVSSLLETGFPKHQIIIWDRRKGLLVATGYDQLAKKLGVGYEGSSDYGYDPSSYYEAALVGNLVYGDHEFGQSGEGIGRKSYVSKLLTQKLTRIIQIHPMLNHYLAGVNGHVIGLATTGVDNHLRFTVDESRHHESMAEICAMPELYDKLAFNLVDGLICQYQGEERGFLQYSVMLKELRISKDPVALDMLSLMEINRQRVKAGLDPHESAFQLYRNAGLMQLGESDPSKIAIQYVR